MEHTLYRSIEEITQPATLSALVQRPITRTRLVPFQPAGWSSTESRFLAVETDDAAAPRYVLKRMNPGRDWVMQATEDQHGRATTIWQHGLLDHLPEEIDPAIIGCAVDGVEYAILMHDVSDALVPEQSSLSKADHECSLNAMAALHATFWESAALEHPALHLCRPEHLITHTAPDKIRRMAATRPSPILEIILEGWRALPALLDADVVELLETLAHDHRPLSAALAACPRTLVHGDWRPANIGFRHGTRPRLVLLDWARPTRTSCAVDLAYYLITSGRNLPLSHEQTIDRYKRELARRLGARFSESWWRPQLALGLLVAFLMIGCFKARGIVHAELAEDRMRQQAELEWWSEQARAAAGWLVW
jgi:aminoglycoside phosphotransferase (APT) family kinase protein